MMETRRLKVYVYCAASEVREAKPELYAFSTDMSGYGYTLVCTKEIEIDCAPPEDRVVAAIRGLRTQEAAVTEKYQQELRAIQTRINDLMALPDLSGGQS